MNHQPLPQQITRMDLDRLRAYRENLDFYNGIQWQGRARGRERRLTFNYAKSLVDKLASYLMTGMTFVVEPEEDTSEARVRAQRAEEALHRTYEENHLEQLDFDTELDSAILGDGAYKVLWDPQERRVRISAPDVQGIYAWWVGDDVTQVWRIASKYRLSREEAEILYGWTSPSGVHDKKEVTILEVWTADQFQLWID